MRNKDRLTEKIRQKIEDWFAGQGNRFIICIREFCQGNRASLTPLMTMVADLGNRVFADGKDLNDDLLNDLEYRMFDLIADFSSTPGGDALQKAIDENIIPRLTEIFAETKRCWNLNYYKLAESIDTLDPENNLIPERESCPDEDGGDEYSLTSAEIRSQARDIIDRLVLFAKGKFNGEKNRKIAINWLENPERVSDMAWLASTAGASRDCTKVTLSRIKKSLAKNHNLRKIGDHLILESVPLRVRETRDSPEEDSL